MRLLLCLLGVVAVCDGLASLKCQSAFDHRSRSALRMSSRDGYINPADRKSFKRFMQVEIYRMPELESLYPILCGIESACRDINRLMRRVTTDNLDGLQGAVNVQGEDQKKLDVIANRIMKQALCCTGKVSIVASEEEDEPCLCSMVTDSTFSGEFAAVFDPLDGSSNIDSGLPTGTIFGVYRNPSFGSSNPEDVIKQRGSNLVVAGYCLYAASCTICLTMRSGLHMFSLDDVTGEFYITRKNVRVPRAGGIYSFNDANSKGWPSGVNSFLNDFKAKRIQHKPAKTPTSRYMGALVADVHNILLNGGIFGYPGTEKAPAGKIRLLYEANPIALIFEAAGGMATDGFSNILDLPVPAIHVRTPVFFGSPEPVKQLKEYLAFTAQMELAKEQPAEPAAPRSNKNLDAQFSI